MDIIIVMKVIDEARVVGHQRVDVARAHGICTCWGPRGLGIIADRIPIGVDRQETNQDGYSLTLPQCQPREGSPSTFPNRSLGPTSNGQAARTLTPGAMTSGLMMLPFMRLGPRDEKKATEGDCRAPYCVPLKMIAAVPSGMELKYVMIFHASLKLTWAVGMTCGSANVVFPFHGWFISIIAAPPAALTTSPFSMFEICPTPHNTIFPLTSKVSMEPFLQFKVPSLRPCRVPCQVRGHHPQNSPQLCSQCGFHDHGVPKPVSHCTDELIVAHGLFPVAASVPRPRRRIYIGIPEGRMTGLKSGVDDPNNLPLSILRVIPNAVLPCELRGVGGLSIILEVGVGYENAIHGFHGFCFLSGEPRREASDRAAVCIDHARLAGVEGGVGLATKHRYIKHRNAFADGKSKRERKKSHTYLALNKLCLISHITRRKPKMCEETAPVAYQVLQIDFSGINQMPKEAKDVNNILRLPTYKKLKIDFKFEKAAT
ncbi:hypothetical protein ACMD2_15493, partial [Ananas comosus]